MKPYIVLREGPSGVGKDTITAALTCRYPDIYTRAPSDTTRAPCPGETEGVEYLLFKDCAVEAVRVLRELYPERVVAIFITAHKEILEKRLLARGDSADKIKQRMADYDNMHANLDDFDYVLENNGTLDEIVQKIHSIIMSKGNK